MSRNSRRKKKRKKQELIIKFNLIIAVISLIDQLIKLLLTLLNKE